MRWLITVLAILAFATDALAQSVGPPTFSVGDTWKRSHGAEPTVVKVDENGVEIKGVLLTCPTCIYQLDKNLTLLNVVQADGKPVDPSQMWGAPLGPDWKLYDFPLEVKKTWRISPTGFFRGSPQRYTADCTVVAYEDVKTKAGTFKAYKIHYEWSLPLATSVIRWNSQLWYAPDVKVPVKFTTTSQSTSPDNRAWELVSYSLK